MKQSHNMRQSTDTSTKQCRQIARAHAHTHTHTHTSMARFRNGNIIGCISTLPTTHIGRDEAFNTTLWWHWNAAYSRQKQNPVVLSCSCNIQTQTHFAFSSCLCVLHSLDLCGDLHQDNIHTRKNSILLSFLSLLTLSCLSSLSHSFLSLSLSLSVYAVYMCIYLSLSSVS